MKQDITYEGGWFFLLAIIPLLIFLYHKYSNTNNASFSVTTIQNLKQRKINTFVSPTIVLFSLRLLTVLFIILGISNIKALKVIHRKAASPEGDIIFALDVSKSMAIEDIKPNRLEALKEVLNRFIAGRQNDRLGIVLYAGEPFYLCTLTKNYPFLLSRLNQMETIDLSDGTAIGSGLTRAVTALQQSNNKSKIIILITDGENNKDDITPLSAAYIAKKFKIKVYTIGIGHTGDALYPEVDITGKKYYRKIKVSVDEVTLRKIAQETGGMYFNAENNKALKNIYDGIDKLETKKTTTITEANYYPYETSFILSALFCLISDFLLRYTLLKTWPQ